MAETIEQDAITQRDLMYNYGAFIRWIRQNIIDNENKGFDQKQVLTVTEALGDFGLTEQDKTKSRSKIRPAVPGERKSRVEIDDTMKAEFLILFRNGMDVADIANKYYVAYTAVNNKIPPEERKARIEEKRQERLEGKKILKAQKAARIPVNKIKPDVIIELNRLYHEEVMTIAEVSILTKIGYVTVKKYITNRRKRGPKAGTKFRPRIKGGISI